MDAMRTYINVLIDTLQKKKKVLEQIILATEQQKFLMQQDSFDETQFMQMMEQKDNLLKELEKLDNGFEQIYERVGLALKHNKELYKEEIISAQQLIQDIMDMSVSIQALEEQNKQRFPVCMTAKRGKIRNFKTSNRAAANYYRNMPNIHQSGQSYFMDQKK